MVDLKLKQQVIELYIKGESERQITKVLPISRNTVRKYLKEFKQSRESDVRNLPIPEAITSPPQYKQRISPKRVLTKEIQEKIQYYVAENEWKDQHYMSKQKMKIIDMHEALLDEGYKIGYTTIRNYVRTIMKKNKEVYIRKHPEAGNEVEFDWGEIKLEIAGKMKPYSLAVFTFPYSNYRFAWLYESESMVCVLDFHVKLIQHINFVPKSFTYDNMRTVVKAFEKDGKKITDQMKALSSYYNFNIRLCNARKGNEKGHVERSVEFIRRKAFSTGHTFESVEAANERIVAKLTKLNDRPHHQHKISRRELLLAEREANGVTMIQPFDAASLVECRIDKYSTITVNTNHYSVPEGHVGEMCRVKVGAETITCFIDGKQHCQHKRDWGLHQWRMDINHYLETFKKKKGALNQSECLKQAPKEIKNIYNQYYIGKEKEFLELLYYINQHQNLQDVLDAIQALEELRSSDVTLDKIIFICEQDKTSPPPEGDVTDNDISLQAEENLRDYENIFQLKDVGVHLIYQ